MGKGKKTIKHAVRLRHLKNLKQFYIGQFELRLDEADLSCLKSEVEDLMLIESTMPPRSCFTMQPVY